MNKYFNKVKDLITEKAGVDPEEIHEESYFEDDLNIGELELVDILTELEDMYDIELDDEREDIETVEDLVNILTDKLE